MRLELLTPPALVGVRNPDGQVLPALLMARRGDRRFVQVSRGPGCNSLAWVGADAVLAAAEAAAVPPPSARGDEQALRPDAQRPVGVRQHRRREPGPAV